MRITEDFLNPLLDRLRSCDWKSESQRVLGFLKSYALRAGRYAARPLLQFYYVMSDEHTTLNDKVLVYASILYVVVPGDLLPRKVLHLLGIVDDLGAVMLAYSKVKSLITPAIHVRVEQTLDEWFGLQAEPVENE